MGIVCAYGLSSLADIMEHCHHYANLNWIDGMRQIAR